MENKALQAYQEFLKVSGYFNHPGQLAFFMAGIAYCAQNNMALNEIAEAIKGIKDELNDGIKTYGQ